MTKPYRHVRFKWRPVDLNEAEEELREENFSIERHDMPKAEGDISLNKDYRNHLLVKADTLIALLEPFRANLSQREAAPFTEKDMKLRKIVLDIYPRNRWTPMPWSFVHEPKFEVAE